jgi:hypothetical protein
VKSVVKFSILMMLLSMCSSFAYAQGPPGKDRGPQVSMLGSPGPSHVTPTHPDNDNPQLFHYTVYVDARGYHPTYPYALNKVAYIGLYTYKGNNPPPLTNPQDGYPTNAYGWTFKWGYTIPGYAPTGELRVHDYHTWEVAYYAPGNYSWLGAGQDDYDGERLTFFSQNPYGLYECG